MVNTVRDYFRNSPFQTLAGRLSPDTGMGDFAKLKIHERLEKQVGDYFKTKFVSVMILVGDQGGGKTWTLSWLYRTFMEGPKDTMAIGVPRIELRGIPERGLLEGLFKGLRPQMNEIKQTMARMEFPSNLKGTTTEYIWNAISDSDAYSILSGSGGRLPTLKGIIPPPMTKTEGTLELFLALFRFLGILGYTKVLVLMDEVESLFVAYGRSNLFIFTNYLRGIYDEFESDNGRTLPRLVLVMSGTYGVLAGVSPELVTRQTDASDASQALLRRLAPSFVLEFRDMADALEIASHRIGVHRKVTEDKPYIPYDEKAIEYVWQHNLGNLGNYCRDLQQMYEFALRERAKMITMEHAKRAVAMFQGTEAKSAS